jgi:soluble lytic murein transglycosylase-like protein
MNHMALLLALQVWGGSPALNHHVDVAKVVHVEATKHDLDPVLVHTVIKHESKGDPSAVSADGMDIGLMQLRLTGAGKGYTKRQLLNPVINIQRGTAYLAAMITHCGSLIRGLGAYNRGPGHCVKNDYAKAVWREYRTMLLKQNS